MSVAVVVEARVPGQSIDQGLTVELALVETAVRVEDLIRQAVAEQVRMLTVQRRLSMLAVRERLVRQYGDDSPMRPEPATDVEREVERALDACRARRCIVIVDGKPVEDLSQKVVLRPDSRVQFLRLVPLQGG